MCDTGILVEIHRPTANQNQTQIQIHSGTYRHQKTATNTHTSPGLSHFGINFPQHLPLQTQLTVSRA